MKTKILITGVAGFIGFNVARKLLNLNYKIIGIDNFTNEMFDDFIGSYGKTPEVIVKKQPKPNKFWDK